MRLFILSASVFFLALILVPFAQAQEFSGIGLWGGAGINNFKGTDFSDKPDLTDNMKLGHVIGVAIFPPVPSEVLLFQVDIYYALKGDQWIDEYNDKVIYNLHYLGADAMLRFVIPLSKFLKPYIAAGGYLELPVSGIYNIKKSDGSKDSGNIEDLPATTVAFADVGLAGEGGVQFRIGKGYLFLSSRYSLGFFKFTGNDSDPNNITWYDIKNRGLSFSAGYMSIFKAPGKEEPAAEPQPAPPTEPGIPGGGV